jgi:hypothetical protein
MKRTASWQGQLVVGLVLVAPLLGGCDKLGGGSGGASEATTAAAESPASPGGDVVRYGNLETNVSGLFTVRAAAKVRKAADKSADVLETLSAGSRVNLLAQYAGGTFSLVQWTGSGGASMTGWLETPMLTQTTTIVLPDAGTRDASSSFQGLGPGSPTGTTPTPPPTTTTPTPPPTTTTPTPPPTTTTPKPPPTTTSTGTKPPPPKPTGTGTSKGTKPPKL